MAASTWTWNGTTGLSTTAADWTLTAGAGNANNYPAPGDTVIVPSGIIEDGLAELAGQGFLTVEAGAEILVTASGDGVSLGTTGGTSGTLTVTGAGALLNVGGASNGIVIGNAGTGDLSVQNTGSVVDTTLSLGGNQTAPGGGKGTLALSGASHVEVLTGLALWSGSTLSLDASSGIDLGSSNFYTPGTVLVESGRTLTGDGLISAGLFNQGVVQVAESHVNGPGTMEITGPVSGIGAFQLAAASVLKLDGALIGSDSIAFPAIGAAALILQNAAPGTITNPISGLNIGDTICFGPAVTSITNAVVSGSTVTVTTNLGNYVFTNVNFAAGAFQGLGWSFNGTFGDWNIQVNPQNVNWNGGSGDLGTAANWSTNSVPLSNETINFNSGAGGTLTGTGVGELANFNNAGTWTLPAGATLTLTGEPGAPYQPYAGSDNGTLTVNGGVLTAGGGFNINGNNGAMMTGEAGAQITFDGLTLGGSPGQEGALLLTGDGTTLQDVAATLPAGFGGYLTVGYASAQTGGLGGGVGHVTITAGASLTDTYGGNLGANTGSEGDVSVTDGGTLSEGYITVGQSGTGTLTINGGTVNENASAIIGQNTSGVGSVSVTNGSFNVGSFAVGSNGSGTVTVGSGGTLRFGGTFNPVGQNAGSTGTLQILNGGTAESTQAPGNNQVFQIGNNGTSGTLAAASGNVLVSGAGSLLNLNGNGFAVGNSGVGDLTVAAGATVEAGVTNSALGGAFTAGSNPGSEAAILVTGSNSALNLVGFVGLGQGGSVNLTVSNSGVVNLTNSAPSPGGVELGTGLFGAKSNTGGEADATVTSSGSLGIQSTLIIGGAGSSGLMNVNNGGVVTIGTGLTVGDANVSNGTTNGGTGSLNIGAGGTVKITESPQLSSFAVEIGTSNGGATGLADGAVTVNGAGALLNTNGNGLEIGREAVGNLTVSQGGTVLAGTPNSNTIAALDIGRYGVGSMFLTDPGSTVTADGFMLVGRGGSGSLQIQNHAMLTVGTDTAGNGSIAIGEGTGSANTVQTSVQTGGDGEAQVTTGGDLYSAQNVEAGLFGTSGELAVDNGGTVEAGQKILLGESETIGAGGSLITSTGTTIVPDADLLTGQGSITVGAGGLLEADGNGIGAAGTSDIVVGNGIGSTGVLNVSGAGATVNSEGFRVGIGAAGQGSLLIGQGGTALVATKYASDQAIYTGGSAGATGSVTVTDPGSELLATGQFSVGLSGQGSLLIENQGTVTTGNNAVDPGEGFDIAQNAGASGTATVTGGKSLLSNTGRFIVGDAGLGSLSIAAGGSVMTSPGSVAGLAGLVIANTSSAAGSSVGVSGASSTLAVAGAIDVGAAGEGSLSVSQGAVVTATNIDEASAASGDGVITVSGTGSALTLSGSLAGTLTVGDQAAGEVSILNGATVSAQSILVGGASAASSGNVDVEGAGSELIIGTGGVLNVGVAGGGSGVLTIGAGTTLQSNAGVIEAGHASFNNNGGVVDPPFVDITTSSNSGLGSNLYDLYVENIGAVQIVSGTGTWDTPMMLTGTSSADATANINDGDQGEWQLSSGGTLIVNANTVDSGQAIVFEDATDTLIIGQIVNNGSDGVSGTAPVVEPGAENVLLTGNFAAEIWGFQTGDKLLFNNMAVTSGTIVNSNTVDFYGPGDVPLGSLAFFTKSGTKGSNAAAAAAVAQLTSDCLAEGSRIETVDGRVRVEDLRAGTLVLTVDGEPEPVVWIARRPVNCARHPKPEMVWPIHVHAGAFGENLPDCDLYLSPNHAVFLNDVLVPVKLLINGTSITQVERSRVTYYHVELPRHAVILAEALPVESYLDTGDRADFSNSGATVRLFPDFGAKHAAENASLWETKGAAPLVMAGAALEAARACLPNQADRPDRGITRKNDRSA